MHHSFSRTAVVLLFSGAALTGGLSAAYAQNQAETSTTPPATETRAASTAPLHAMRKPAQKFHRHAPHAYRVHQKLHRQHHQRAAPQGEWLSLRDIYDKLQSEGYKDIRSIKRSVSSYHAFAHNAKGQPVKLYVEPLGGHVVSLKNYGHRAKPMTSPQHKPSTDQS